MAMKFMPLLTIAALAVAVVVGVVIWHVIGDAPWEDNAGPQHTAVEVLEAARAQESTLARCDDNPELQTLPPKWDNEREVWVLSCVGRRDSVIGASCYEVDDETLEVSRVEPLTRAFYLEYCPQ